MSDSDRDLLPSARPRGRAATLNPQVRFEATRRVAVDDGWERDEDLPPLRTEVSVERPRKIITRNRSPDVPFDRSINPYRGCEHGCIYCFARPTHAYLGLSPGLDFETRLIVRPDAPDLLARELSNPRYRVAPIAIGTNTDPYQAADGRYGITRRLLEVLRDFRHPVTIATKGAVLILRDLDLLADMAAMKLVTVGIGVTTLDRALARRMEPRVPDPARRLAAIRELSDAGVPVRIMVAPVVPALTDHEIEPILEAGAGAGATAATWAMLRLPLEVAPLVKAWLTEHYPDRAARVLGRIRETHGGVDYDPQWGKRMRGQGVHAELIARRFAVTCKRLGLEQALPDLDSTAFRVPDRPGGQLSLF